MTLPQPLTTDNARRVYRRVAHELAEVLADVPVSTRWRPVLAAVIADLECLAHGSKTDQQARFESGLPWRAEQLPQEDDR